MSNAQTTDQLAHALIVCARGAKCFSDPDCRALFECTLASGALGRYAILDFDVANPPCPELLKKSGGAQGDAAQIVMDLWSCNLKSGCFAVCDGE